jgi:hypothetical protein
MSNQEISTITSAKDIVFNNTAMGQLHEVAKLMASSVCTVPKHLQGNVGDCFAIALQAMQWGMNPFAVAQKTHTVQGTLGYEAQLVNAVITTMAPTKGRLQFEWFGDWSRVIGNFKELEGKNGKYRKLVSTLADEKGCGVKVWATLRGEEKPRELSLLLTQAGTRNSTLWADDPKQQLAYLAIKRWARLYCPDVIMGVYSDDELQTIDAEKEINPIPTERSGNKENSSQTLPLSDLLVKIKSMSIGEFKEVDHTQYSADEKQTIRRAMSDRKRQIEAERQASVVAETTATRVDENPDWAVRIKACQTHAQMDALLKEMPESVQMELQEDIDLHYDVLR